jgi:hypothetical protein
MEPDELKKFWGNHFRIHGRKKIMIKKIISGGRIGADQAALDVAIKMGIPHGGWIQKGRKTQRGILPEKYQLKEMPVAGFKERIEQNIIDSDGTVIISHGNLTGGSDYGQEMAKKHKRPCLHIDLNETPLPIAPSKLNTWIIENNIEVLNVTGSRTSEDAEIYKDTMNIVEGTILLALIGAKPDENLTDFDKKDYLKKLPIPPKTIDEAIERLIYTFDLEDKLKIANMRLNDLLDLPANEHAYFKDALDLLSGNKDLLASCRSISKEHVYNEDDAIFVIMEALWKKLRQTHKLRVVK